MFSIKVNLSDYRMAESGATTDPILLGHLLDCLKCRYPGSDICVLENDATAVECESPFSLLGIQSLVERHGAKLFSIVQGG